jgi:hypothetical protein
VDTREQNPFDFSRFAGWLSGIEKKALKLGDYSVAGLEAVCAVERKDLSDLVHSCTVDRRGLERVNGNSHRRDAVGAEQSPRGNVGDVAEKDDWLGRGQAPYSLGSA